MATKQQSSKKKVSSKKFIPEKAAPVERHVLYARIQPKHFARVSANAEKASVSVSKYMDMLFDKLSKDGVI